MSTTTKHRNETMAEALRAAGVREAVTPYGTVESSNGDGVRIRATRAQARMWATMAGVTMPDEGMEARLPAAGGDVTDLTPPGRETAEWARDVLIDAVVHQDNGWLTGYLAARATEVQERRAASDADSMTVREATIRVLHEGGDWATVEDIVEAAPRVVGRELKPGSVYDALNRQDAEGEDEGVKRRKEGRRVVYHIA